MTLKEIIKRRIVLKEQHIFIIRSEIQALEADLREIGDDESIIEYREMAQWDGQLGRSNAQLAGR